MGKEKRVASTSDLKPGDMLAVEAGGEPLLLVNVAGNLYAVSDTCTHAGCNLSEGTLEGNEVECPCHEGRFNVMTGEVTQEPPEESLNKYVVHVRGNDIFIENG